MATFWHATRHLSEILTDNLVKPMRMGRVYVFSTRAAADAYAREFGYAAVVEVNVPDVSEAGLIGRWSPSYANGADVLCFWNALSVVRHFLIEEPSNG